MADDVLACRSFDEARARYPSVIEKALSGGPPEEVFSAHWAPDAQYHGSLRALVSNAVSAIGFVAPAAAPPPAPMTAAVVLACRSFDEARERYPQAIQAALHCGPPEDVFRAHWAPDAQYHASLRTVMEKAVETAAGAAAPAPAPAAAPPPTEEVQQPQEVEIIEMERPCAGAGGIFWGFLVGKNLKVLEVMKDTPSEKAGLKKGVFVLEASTSEGTVKIESPKDTYGPTNQFGTSHSLWLKLTTTKTRPTLRPQCPFSESDQIEAKRAKKADDQGYADVGFSIAGDPSAARAASRSRSPSPPPVARRARGWDRNLVARGDERGADAERRPVPRPARVGDKIVRANGKKLDDYGWILPAGKCAEVLTIWRSSDPKNGQLRCRGPDGKESGWLPADGWRVGTKGPEYGIEILIPPPSAPPPGVRKL